MPFVLKLRDVLVGRSDLAERDTERRAARGSFRPGLGWELVEPIFTLADGTEAPGTSGGDAQRARYRRARDTLALSLHRPDGDLLETARIDILRDSASPTGLVLDVAIVDDSFWRP
ncbi:MAG: hypothetical protein IPF98_20465 [Gemmatimonadetes bacterium]|jgi:hypothetical protein|nr:hypothetical protein [Gemmatimonadota bacterium]